MLRNTGLGNRGFGKRVFGNRRFGNPYFGKIYFGNLIFGNKSTKDRAIAAVPCHHPNPPPQVNCQLRKKMNTNAISWCSEENSS